MFFLLNEVREIFSSNLSTVDNDSGREQQEQHQGKKAKDNPAIRYKNEQVSNESASKISCCVTNSNPPLSLLYLDFCISGGGGGFFFNPRAIT